MSQEEENSSFADKRKVSPAADEPNAKRPAIAGLLDPSLTRRFLNDPNIDDLCKRLAKNKHLVQTAQQLVKALEDARLENGSLNDDALKHFSLVGQVWQNGHFYSELHDTFTSQERVLGTIIEELSNRVEDEPIEGRMTRIKGDNSFKHILDATNPAPTMMRGLLIIILGYWSYKKLPLKLGEEYGCGVVGDEEEVANIVDATKQIELGEKSMEYDHWLMEFGSPTQILNEEPGIVEIADDLITIPRLVKMAERCMESLHSFDPQDKDVTLCYAKEHCDLAHQFLEDSEFFHLLVEKIKLDGTFGHIVTKYSKRAPVLNEDALVTVNEIIKDPGLVPYKELNKKKDVGALRVFLSILIVYWIDNDVYAKIHKELADYAKAQRAAIAAAKLAKPKDTVSAEIKYPTRFAGDLKGLKAVLDDVYGSAPHGHMFDKLKNFQFRRETMARITHYDVEMDVEASLGNGGYGAANVKLRHQ